MWYIYILLSKIDRKLYIGFTNNLKSRLKAHNEGYVKATKNRRPLILIYYEAYRIELDAKQRERYLKGGKGRSDIKVQLKGTFRKYNYQYR